MNREDSTPLAATLIVLGIVFGSDRLVGYSFIGAGVLLSIICVIKSRQAAIARNRTRGDELDED